MDFEACEEILTEKYTREERLEITLIEAAALLKRQKNKECQAKADEILEEIDR